MKLPRPLARAARALAGHDDPPSDLADHHPDARSKYDQAHARAL